MTDSEDPWADHIRVPTPDAAEAATAAGSTNDTSASNDPLQEVTSPAQSVQAAPSATAAHPLDVESTPIAAQSPPEPLLDPLQSLSLTSTAGPSDTQEGEEQAEAAPPTPKPKALGTAQSIYAIKEPEEEEEQQQEEEVEEGEIVEEDDDDEEEEEFVYPGAAVDDEEESQQAQQSEAVEAEPAAAEPEEASPPAPSPRAAPAAAELPPIDYTALAQLATNAPLSFLQAFFTRISLQGHSSFALANEPSPSSGLVPLHYAAREGRLDVVRWLVEEAGAMVELEDREGETALHKAALAGKLPVLSYLLSRGASANAVDFDGWTPLHNACSRGYLDIVRVLVENAEAHVDVKGGRGEWTPLMNAAAGGHLPVVRYLCSKWNADAFARNSAGETAYDVAAATFETYVCEVLEKYEAERWSALRFSTPPAAGGRSAPAQAAYNPLRLHTTVPVILHQNERLDTRLSTLAVHGGKPRWSGTSAGRTHKPDRRAPGTMPPGPLSSSRTRNVPMRREDIGLPLREAPYKLVLPSRATQVAAATARRRAAQSGAAEDLASTPTPQSVLGARGAGGVNANGEATTEELHEEEAPKEKCHFWLSAWQLDLTHPQVDAHEGWQYAQSFDAPEERWTAAVPPPLARLLEGRGLGASVSRAMTGGVLPGPGQTALGGLNGMGGANEQEAVATGWVRRRRWVRVMRRRLDIEVGDELEAAELAHLSASASYAGTSFAGLTSAVVVQAEQEARQQCAALGASADYVARAQALAGHDASAGVTPADLMGQGVEELRKRIARFDLAVAELRASAFADENTDRRSRAEDLLKEYTLQLGQLKQAAGLEEGSEDEDEDDEDAEFIYPNSYKDDGQSVITRIAPLGHNGMLSAGRPQLTTRISSSSASVFGGVAPSEAGTSIGAMRSADLAAAAEFAVPHNEVPNRPAVGVPGSGLREQNLIPTWQSDADVQSCPDCQRRFTFFIRKHHCRRCGQIRCDRCSTHRVHLSPAELVIDPGVPEMLFAESAGPTRVCNACYADHQLPSSVSGGGGGQRWLSAHISSGEADLQSSGVSDVSSRASELNECPVCNTTLATLGDSAAQEEHVRTCLENGGGGKVQGGRYLVYKLADGPIVGKECVICLEDLQVGMTIARLPCLCYYHRHCIDSWFSRGKACPTHARAW